MSVTQTVPNGPNVTQTVPTPSSGGSSAIITGWRPLWNLDCTAQDDHDLLTEGAYEDSTGVTTWDITDDTVHGSAYVSEARFQNGVGFVATSNSNSPFGLAQELSTLYPGIKAQDRVALVLDLDTSNIASNFHFVKLAVGTRTWGTSTHTAISGYANALYSGTYQRDGGAPSIGANVNGSVYDCMGLDFSDQQARSYFRASYGVPWDGWTAGRRTAWNDNPTTADDSRPTPADSWFQFDFGRNNGPDLTVTIRRMALFGWVPDFAGA